MNKKAFHWIVGLAPLPAISMVFIGLILLHIALPTVAQAAITDAIVVEVNVLRQAARVQSVTINAALMQAAQTHSDDMAQAGVLSHVGTDGSQFWERAAQAGYPMTTGAQNVLARNTSDARIVVEQWQQSAANNANLISADYVEIGVGASLGTDGNTYYTLLVGSRADYVTPLPAPTATREPIQFGTPASIILVPTSTSLASINTPAPTMTQDAFVQTLTAPLPTASVAPMIPTVTRDPSAVMAQATISVVTATPVLMSDIRFFLSPETLIIQNVSGRVLDLSMLQLETGTDTLSVQRWDNGSLTTSLAQFPSGDCLQAWGLGLDQPLPRPSQCQQRHGWIALNAANEIWRNADQFAVVNADIVVGYCAVNANQATTCDISLQPPQNVLAVPSRATTEVSIPIANDGVVRLYLNGDSVVLHNITGSSIDITDWVFESESDTMPATQWELSDLSRPLYAIPSGDCVQVWGAQTLILPKPEQCRYRHGWVAVGENRQFWAASGFEVRDGGRTLATCTTSAATCDIVP